MATITLNPVLDSISGTIGRMVFYKRYNRTITRAWIMPPNPNTPAQSKNRSRFREAMVSWQGLSSDVKAAYNTQARKLGMTGHNLYIRKYMSTQTGIICDDMNDDREVMRPSFSSPSSPLRRGGREVRSSSHPAYPFVTAPSAPAHWVFTHPIEDSVCLDCGICRLQEANSG